MQPVMKSAKLANVCYDIRGPVAARARQMEEEGHKIIKLNIGNLAALMPPRKSSRTSSAICPMPPVTPIPRGFSRHARR